MSPEKSPEKSNKAQPSDEQKSPKEAEATQAKERSTARQESTKPTPPYSVSEAGGPLSEIDEGPAAGPVDEIQQALFEAAQANLATDVDLSELGSPTPDFEAGPASGSTDEVQEAIEEAARSGRTTEVDFDTLPTPTLPLDEQPKKVVKFKTKAPPTGPTAKPTGQPDASLAEEPAPISEPLEADPRPAISDYWFILALFITFRILTLFLLRPGGYIRDWSDFDTYFGIAALSDYALYPFLDFWLEWPPLVPWLAVGAYNLALSLPPWPDDPRLWFILILGTVFLLFEIGNFVLTHRLARRLFREPATIQRVLWFYAGLFPPLYAMLGFFDGVALFFMLLTLELILTDRRFLSAIAVGLGFMVKILPILMLLVALRRLWHQYRDNNRAAGIEAGLYGVVFGLTIIVLLAPFIILPALDDSPQWWMVTARSILGRSSWETVWAVGEGYYGFGAVGGDRLDPNIPQADFAIHTGWPNGIWLLIGLLFAGVYGYLFTRPANYDHPRPLIAFAALTGAIFLLYSKGYSPQFLVYLLPFILLLMPNGRGLTYALILTGLNVLEQPIYFVMLPDSNWLLIFIVWARFITILLLAGEFSLVLWPVEERLATLAPIRERAPLVLGVVAALAFIVLTPLMVLAYSDSRLTNSPVGTLTGFMQVRAQDSPEEPRLLLSDQETYRQLYPHLHSTVDLQLADGAAKFSGAASVGDLVWGLNQVWILPTGPQQNALRNAVANRGELLASYNFEGLGILSLYTFRPNPIPLIAPARFTGGIELLDHQLQLQDRALRLTLYWRALNPQTQNLKVFTQLLNASGDQVAGQDSVPKNGTAPVTEWPVEAIIADPHRIEIPANLSPGQYTVIVGLYNNFNERVRSIDPAGFGHPNHAVRLEAIQLP